MRERIGITSEEILGRVGLPDSGEFPLPVVPDWDELVSKADEMARIIDRHLDYESIYQGHDLDPAELCPEQRVNLVSDLVSSV